MKEFFRHFFTPHASNNHRAKALHVDAMFLYVVAFLFFNIAIKSIHNKYPDVLGYATNIQVERLLAQTNVKRAEAGLKPLVLNQQLSQAAAAKAADMFAKSYWAHVAPDGKTPWDFVVGAGYKYTVAGENLAKNFQDSDGVVNAWMNSPSHRDNLLKSSYREIGFAIVNGKLQGEETTLVVQMFGTRPGGVVAQVQAAAPEIPIEVAPAVVAIAPSPVVIPEVASSTTLSNGFSQALIKPKVDIIKLKRDVTLMFAGILLGIFVVDLYVALRRRTVRAVGSTFAHVLFFAVIALSMNSVLQGTIL